MRSARIAWLRPVFVFAATFLAAVPNRAHEPAAVLKDSAPETSIVVHAGCTGQPNGGPCDDADPCTSGDSCTGGICAGSPSSPMPPEITQLAFARFGSDAEISWTVTEGSQGVDVVRGKSTAGSASPLGVGQTCLGRGLDPSTTSITDSVNPPAGTAFWYLVRGTNACGIGPWGTQLTDGVERARATMCGCTPDPSATPSNRYVDHFYTVTDRMTCLEWEKKAVVSALHDPYFESNWYEATGFVTVPPNWIQAVNAERFAGHGDWRLPTSWGPPTHRSNASPEIESLLLTPCPAFPTPCIDPAFGAFPSGQTVLFWSASTANTPPYGAEYAWGVDCMNGGWEAGLKRFYYNHVRAVRGGF